MVFRISLVQNFPVTVICCWKILLELPEPELNKRGHAKVRVQDWTHFIDFLFEDVSKRQQEWKKVEFRVSLSLSIANTLKISGFTITTILLGSLIQAESTIWLRIVKTAPRLNSSFLYDQLTLREKDEDNQLWALFCPAGSIIFFL